MKLTKTFFIISVLAFLLFGNTWVAASHNMSNGEYRIGIASSQSTIDTSKSTLNK